MQHDCAACHSGLPYVGLADEALAAGGEVQVKVAEIVAAAPATERNPLQSLGATQSPDPSRTKVA